MFRWAMRMSVCQIVTVSDRQQQIRFCQVLPFSSPSPDLQVEVDEMTGWITAIQRLLALFCCQMKDGNMS